MQAKRLLKMNLEQYAVHCTTNNNILVYFMRVTPAQFIFRCLECQQSTRPFRRLGYDTIRYDTRSYFNVHSKADVSQLNLPHGIKLKSGKEKN